MGDANRVVLFSRYPLPGKAKTRLIPELGEAGAAECQVVMTEKLVREMGGMALELWYKGGDKEKMEYWLGRLAANAKVKLSFKEQVDGDLGAKIAGAFRSAFNSGAERVTIVGADIPGLSRSDIEASFTSLSEENPMAIQPALDGGYVLVGLHKAAANSLDALFCSGTIPWGEDTVLEAQTAAAAAASVPLLRIGKALSDVDTPEEIPAFTEATGVPVRALKTPILAIVTPTLNEAKNLEACIAGWLQQASRPQDIRIMIADGGSRDATLSVVSKLQERFPGQIDVVKSEKGRGAQCNAGATAVGISADVIMFTHADTQLPARFDAIALDVLRTPGVSAGCFSFDVDKPVPGLWMIVKLVNARCRRAELPYGDQSIYCYERTLRRVGGVRADHPLLEDVALVRALQKVGHIATASAAVLTSSRRWVVHGVFKITTTNHLIMALYGLGVHPKTLYKWYYAGVPLWWVPLVVVPLLVATSVLYCMLSWFLF